MSQTYFARSMAAAAMVAMLGVSAPALAQTTQGTGTQGTTTTQGTTGSQTPQSVTPSGQTQVQCLQRPATTNTNDANSPTGTATDRSSKGNKPIEGSGNASNAPSGATSGSVGADTTNNGDCPTSGTTTPSSVTHRSTQPMNSTSGSNSNSGTMNTGGSMNSGGSDMNTMAPTAGSTMQNTLRDNPNGSNWLAKFNRPAVAASNRKSSKYRTNKLGTTSQPPKR